MSAINTDTQIPASVNTMEKLAAWVGLHLAQMHPNLAVLETQINNELVAQAGIFRAQDGSQRLLIRLSLELESDFTSQDTQLWNSIKEFMPQTALLPSFLD